MVLCLNTLCVDVMWLQIKWGKIKFEDPGGKVSRKHTTYLLPNNHLRELNNIDPDPEGQWDP